MLDKRELLEAIEDCENNLNSYRDCERLAALYVVYNQKYGKKNAVEPIIEVVVQDNGNSEFLSAIRGKNAYDVWNIIDKLMQDLQADNPRLYEHVMSQF